MIREIDHFGHREAAGIVVDLFWDRRDLHDEFRVEVKDRRDGTRFVLYRARGDPGLSSPVLGAARHTGGVRGTRPDEVLLPAAGRSQITTEEVLT